MRPPVRVVLRGAVAVVALGAIGFAGFRLLKQYTAIRSGPGNRWASRVLKASGDADAAQQAGLLPETKDAPDPDAHLNWSLEARPWFAYPSEAPVCDDTTYADRRFVIAQESDPEAVRPVILLDMLVDVLTPRSNVSPALRSGYRNLVLLRADGPNGEFTECARFTRLQLNEFRARRAGLVSARDPDAGGIWRTRLFFLDHHAPQGIRCRYKARFLAEDERVLAASGECSAFTVPVPVCRGRVQGSDLVVSYPGLSLPPGVTRANVSIRMEAAYWGVNSQEYAPPEFASASALRPGELRMPLVGSPFIHPGRFPAIAVRYLREGTVWSETGGEATVRGWEVADLPVVDDDGVLLDLEAFATPPPEANVRVSTVQYRGSGKYSIVAPPAIDGTPVVEITCEGTVTGTVRSGWSVDLEPGFAERWTVSGKHRDMAESDSYRWTIVRPPRPSGLRADGCEEGIRISWDPIRIDPEDWVYPPEFVVFRVEGDAFPPYQPDATPVILEPVAHPYREIHRCGTGMSEYVDRDVSDDAVYFYRLVLQGVARQTVSAGEITADAYHVLEVRAGVGNRVQAVAAVPGTPGILRVAVIPCPPIGVVFKTVPSDRILKAIEDKCRDEPGIRLVERRMLGTLMREEDYDGPPKAEQQEEAHQPVSEVADVLVECEAVPIPRLPGVYTLTLVDYRNGRRYRVPDSLVRDAGENPGDRVVRALRRHFPERFGVSDPTTADAREPVAVAVQGFKPRSPGSAAALPRDVTTELVRTELGSTGRCEVVERALLDKVLREQETASTLGREGDVALGRLVGADFLVSGMYEVRGEILFLHAYPLEVRTGAHFRSVVASGPAEDPATVGRRLAEKLDEVLVPTPPIPPVRDAALRHLEVISTRGRNPLGQSTNAAYLGQAVGDRTARHARELVVCGRYAEGLAVAMKGIDEGESGRRDLFPLFDYADFACRKLERHEDRVALWERGVRLARRNPEVLSLSAAAAGAIAALTDAGRPEQGKALLPEVGASEDPAPVIAMHMALREYGSALEILADLPTYESRTVKGRYDLQEWQTTPPYRTLVQVIEEAEGDDRAAALNLFIRKAGTIRPYQANAAARILRKGSGIADAAVPEALGAAVTVGDAKLTAELMARLDALDPDSALPALAKAARAAHALGNGDVVAECARRAEGLKPKGTVAAAARGTVELMAARPLPPPRTFTPDNEFRTSAARPVGHHMDGRIFVLTRSGYLVCMDESSGSILWHRDVGYPILYLPDPDREPIHRAEFVLNHTLGVTPSAIYVSNPEKGFVRAYDPATGACRWQHVEWTLVSPPLPYGRVIAIRNGFGTWVILDEEGSVRHRVSTPAGIGSPVEERFDIMNVWHLNKDAQVQWTPWAQACELRELNRNQFRRRSFATMREDIPGIGAGVDYVRGSDALNLETHEAVSGMPVPMLDPATYVALVRNRNVPPEIRLHYLPGGENLLGRAEFVSFLEEAAADSEEVGTVRSAFLQTMVREDPLGSMPVLTDILADPEHALRPVALACLNTQFLTRLGLSDYGLDCVRRLARHNDEDVRERAVICLVDVLGRDALQDLEPILKDPANPLCYEVALRLVEDGCREAVPALVASMRGAQKDRAFRATWALARIGYRPAVDAIVRMMNLEEQIGAVTVTSPPMPRMLGRTTVNPGRRISEVLAMMRMVNPGPDVLPHLRKLIAEGAAPVAREAAFTLACVAEREAVPLLIDVLENLPEEDLTTTPESRRDLIVGSALTDITGRDFAGDPLAWREWWQKYGMQDEPDTQRNSDR